ncbi:STM3941 family protein [Mesorhizobium caraganae]|uniref:STM3941 family protein n=1 Tax=Mesorhizobium caraganae TaxID=483206 RepID=UPI00333C1170
MRYGTKTVEPLVIRASRGKTLLLLLASLVFVFASVFLIRASESDETGLWWGIAFFRLCALVFAWALVRPQTLMLDGNGFAVGGGFVRSPHHIPWKDVQGFYVYSLPRGGKMIGYNFEPGARKDSALRSVARSLGAEAALPKGWPFSPEEMAVLLNEYRRRAMTR